MCTYCSQYSCDVSLQWAEPWALVMSSGSLEEKKYARNGLLQVESSLYIYIYIYNRERERIYIYIYICIYMLICIYMYVYIYIYVIHVYVYIYIYIYICKWPCVVSYNYIYTVSDATERWHRPRYGGQGPGRPGRAAFWRWFVIGMIIMIIIMKIFV